jgi:hypothetical protein
LESCNQGCPGYPDQKCGNKGAGLFAYVALDGAPVSGSETTSTVSILVFCKSAPVWYIVLTVISDLFYLKLYHARHDFRGRRKQLFRRHQRSLDRLEGQRHLGLRRGVLHRRFQQRYGPSCHECYLGCRHELGALIHCVSLNAFISPFSFFFFLFP